MECKKLGKGNRGGSLMAPAMDCMKLGSVFMSSRTAMFASAFASAFIVCSIYMAFNYPSKMVINPILIQREAWFHWSSNSSSALLSFFFSNSGLSPSSDKFTHDAIHVKQNHVPDKSKANMTVQKASQPTNRKNGPTNAPEHFRNTTVSTVPMKRNDIRSGGHNGLETDKPLQLISFGPNREADRNGIDAASLALNETVSRTEKTYRNPVSRTEQTYGNHSGSVSVSRLREKQCNIFSGRWVRDSSYPYYAAGSCPHIDESFNCFKNNRPDNEYEKWRWQPHDCSIPRLNATDMLERLRGKRLTFVGDSLNRNMWESLVCILRHVVEDKGRVYEISGRHDFKTQRFYAFRFEDYNCSVEFVRAPFLVQEGQMPAGNGSMKDTLRLDVMDNFAPKYKEADVIVFNTGHWWSHDKTSRGKDYYQEGNDVYPLLDGLEAFRKAIRTWGRWLDSSIDSRRTQVFFRGYSASHFSGGQWNSGGKCHKESQPIFKESYITKYPPMMDVLESVMKEIKTPVTYLNITRITDYRKDAHPSIYRKQYLSQNEQLTPEKYQDCSHWCLPGVPDTWNELLYASLLMTRQGLWAL
eukprot:PITA_00922